MDYEKAYKHALDLAKQVHDTTISKQQKENIEIIFPELAESEDEKIKKELINFLQLPHPQFVGERKQEKWIAWLEKQIPIDEEKVLIGARKDVALSIMNFLDRNTLGMDLSNMECEDIENAVVNEDWDKVYGYMKKKLEKQGEQKWNPYSGTSFEYNGHTWGMCARDGGVEILMDSELKAFVSLDKSFVYPIHPQPDLAPKSALEAIKEEKVDNQNCVKPADKIEPIDEYEGLTDFERTLADICIGWIGQELGWKQYIKDNADALLQIAVEKFNSVQDAPFERKSAWSEDYTERMGQIINYLKCQAKEEPTRRGTLFGWVALLKSIFRKGLPEIQMPCDEVVRKEIHRIMDVLEWAADKGRISDSDCEDYMILLSAYLPQPKIVWSEEDEENFKGVMDALNFCNHEGINPYDIDPLYLTSWFKSIKQRIGGISYESIYRFRTKQEAGRNPAS